MLPVRVSGSSIPSRRIVLMNRRVPPVPRSSSLTRFPPGTPGGGSRPGRGLARRLRPRRPGRAGQGRHGRRSFPRRAACDAGLSPDAATTSTNTPLPDGGYVVDRGRNHDAAGRPSGGRGEGCRRPRPRLPRCASALPCSTPSIACRWPIHASPRCWPCRPTVSCPAPASTRCSGFMESRDEFIGSGRFGVFIAGAGRGGCPASRGPPGISAPTAVRSTSRWIRLPDGGCTIAVSDITAAGPGRG